MILLILIILRKLNISIKDIQRIFNTPGSEVVLEVLGNKVRNIDDEISILDTNYFIFKGTGKDRNSTLEVWVERYKDEMSRLPSTTSDITSRMQ